MKSPIAPKNTAGTLKNASAGRIRSISGPAIPNVKSNAQASGLTTIAKR